MKMYNFNKSEIDGVIFDLDGVITNTASLHEIAWKQSFDKHLQKISTKKFSKHDYINHIDGKPRLKGIHDYLIFRKIKINKSLTDIINIEKNNIFLGLIESRDIEVYDDTINLIKLLKKYKIKIAVASSSKNCRLILKKIALIDTFDFIIDGLDLEKKNINGKPEPTIFKNAIKELGLEKNKTIIIEDSSSGIISAVKSGAKYVIGIARKSNELELKKSCPHIILNTLNQIRIIE